MRGSAAIPGVLVRVSQFILLLSCFFPDIVPKSYRSSQWSSEIGIRGLAVHQFFLFLLHPRESTKYHWSTQFNNHLCQLFQHFFLFYLSFFLPTPEQVYSS